MKKQILLIAIIFLSIPSFGQKLKIDKVRLSVEFIRLPRNYVQPEMRTYSVSGLRANNLQIDGWKRVNQDPTIRIVYRNNEFTMGEGKQLNNKRERKDKEGNVISTTYTYAISSDNAGRGVFEIFGYSNPYQNNTRKREKERKKEAEKEEKKEENPFLKGGAEGSDGDEQPNVNIRDRVHFEVINLSYDYTTTYVQSSSAAWRTYNNNKYSMANNHRRQFAQDVQKRIEYNTNLKYGYSSVKEHIKMQTIANSSHPEHEKYNQAMEAAKVILQKTSSNKSISGLRDEMKPVVEYLEGVAKDCDMKNKHQRKLKIMTLSNLAIIHFYLDDFEKTIQYSEELETFTKKSPVKKLHKEAEALIEELKFHHMTERHMAEG